MHLLLIWLACHSPATSQKTPKESLFSPDSTTTSESSTTDSPTDSPSDSPTDSPTDSGPRLTTLPDHITAQGIILVQVDALRTDHLGVYGYGRNTTPTLSSENWLRIEGVSSTASWTPLSVSSLMTSLPPYQHGVRYFNTSTNALNALLTAPRWSDALQAAGISTFLATGSYFFDVSTGIGGGFSAVSTSDKRYPTNHLDSLIPTVLDWLTALPPDVPFFVVLHAMNAHDPYFSTEETVNTWTDPRLLPLARKWTR